MVALFCSVKSWIAAVCERLGQQLQDHRAPSKVQTSQLRTLMIQHAQGWDDLSDTGLLSEAPVFQLACSGLPSQLVSSPLCTAVAERRRPSGSHRGLDGAC